MLARPDTPVVVIENPVAIEKGGGSPMPTWYLPLSKRQRFGDPDVDEIAVDGYSDQPSVMSEDRK
jgi:hypothetical protein